MPPLDHLLSSLQTRVLTAHRAPLPPSWSVPEQRLPFNKIYYAFRGTGGYAVDGVEFPFRAGWVGLLPAKCLNRCWHDPSDPFEKIWVHFDARVLGLVDLFDVIPCPPPFPLDGDPETLDMLNQMVREFQTGEAERPFRPLALNGLLALALARILRKAAQGGAARPPKKILLRGPGDRIGRVLQYIAEHYAEPLTLDALAAVIHLQPAYFSNIFRKAAGQAPMAFLRRFRIERAKGLLASSGLSVSETAGRVGFSDPYHFSRVFKKWVGVSPSAFQESVRRGDILQSESG